MKLDKRVLKLNIKIVYIDKYYIVFFNNMILYILSLYKNFFFIL